MQASPRIIKKWSPILEKVGLTFEEDIKLLAMFAENTSIIESSRYSVMSGSGMGSINGFSSIVPPNINGMNLTVSSSGQQYLPISIKTLKDIIPFICLNPLTEKEFKPIFRKSKIERLLNNNFNKSNIVTQNITQTKEYDFVSNGENLLTKKVISNIILNIIDIIKTLDYKYINRDNIASELKSIINNDLARCTNTNLSLIVNNDNLYDYIDRVDEILISDSFKYLGKFNNIKVYRNLTEHNNECYIINKNKLRENGLVLSTDTFIKNITLTINTKTNNHDMSFLLSYIIEKKGDNPLDGFRLIKIQ